MVLTTARTTAFFKNADHMGVEHAMVVQLAQEGIQSVDDLADFDKEALQQLADNLQHPGERSPILIQVQPLVKLSQRQLLCLGRSPRNAWELPVNWFDITTLWAVT